MDEIFSVSVQFEINTDMRRAAIFALDADLKKEGVAL
jgi:hypothetical protein